MNTVPCTSGKTMDALALFTRLSPDHQQQILELLRKIASQQESPVVSPAQED